MRFTKADRDLLSKQSKAGKLSRADFLRQCSIKSKPYLPVQQSLPTDVPALLKNLEKLSETRFFLIGNDMRNQVNQTKRVALCKMA